MQIYWWLKMKPIFQKKCFIFLIGNDNEGDNDNDGQFMVAQTRFWVFGSCFLLGGDVHELILNTGKEKEAEFEH